jgi:hypothetical protein
VDVDGLTDLSRNQAAVATRVQLRALGYTRKHVERRVKAAIWQALGRHVIVLVSGALTEEQRQWAAVLSCGGVSALAADSALLAHGVALITPGEAVHVVIRRGDRPSDLPWVKVHESRRFTVADVHPARSPARVRLERAAVDAAAWATTDRRACGLLLATVQQRLTTPGRLARELRLAGQIKRIRLLTAILKDAAGGAQALSEVDLGRLSRRHGLPEPVRQAARRDKNGKRRWLDATFRRADGRLVVAEVDGAVHLLPSTYWDDMARGNEIVIRGERLLRFPAIAIYLEPDRVADQLRRALGLPDLSATHGRVVPTGA